MELESSYLERVAMDLYFSLSEDSNQGCGWDVVRGEAQRAEKVGAICSKTSGRSLATFRPILISAKN